eukprot:Nk52_evm69s151 gene=Nk52_evmTU69s151
MVEQQQRHRGGGQGASSSSATVVERRRTGEHREKEKRGLRRRLEQLQEALKGEQLRRVCKGKGSVEGKEEEEALVEEISTVLGDPGVLFCELRRVYGPYVRRRRREKGKGGEEEEEEEEEDSLRLLERLMRLRRSRYLYQLLAWREHWWERVGGGRGVRRGGRKGMEGRSNYMSCGEEIIELLLRELNISIQQAVTEGGGRGSGGSWSAAIGAAGGANKKIKAQNMMVTQRKEEGGGKEETEEEEVMVAGASNSHNGNYSRALLSSVGVGDTATASGSVRRSGAVHTEEENGVEVGEEEALYLQVRAMVVQQGKWGTGEMNGGLEGEEGAGEEGGDVYARGGLRRIAGHVTFDIIRVLEQLSQGDGLFFSKRNIREGQSEGVDVCGRVISMLKVVYAQLRDCMASRRNVEIAGDEGEGDNDGQCGFLVDVCTHLLDWMLRAARCNAVVRREYAKPLSDLLQYLLLDVNVNMLNKGGLSRRGLRNAEGVELQGGAQENELNGIGRIRLQLNEGALHSLPKLRAHCLHALGHVCDISGYDKRYGEVYKKDNMDLNDGELSAQLCCTVFLKDNDPRVRAAALRSLIVLHRRGGVLDFDLCFDQIYGLTRDDSESVRIEVVKLLWIFSNTCPNEQYTCSTNDVFLTDTERIAQEEHEVLTSTGINVRNGLAASGNEVMGARDTSAALNDAANRNGASFLTGGAVRSNRRMRLIDCGFCTLCDLLNDYSVRVRVIAGSFLGQLKNVDEALLMQTLDKKLMSHMKKTSGYGKFAKRKEGRIAEQSSAVASMLNMKTNASQTSTQKPNWIQGKTQNAPSPLVGNSPVTSRGPSPSAFGSGASTGAGVKRKRKGAGQSGQSSSNRRGSLAPEGDSEMGGEDEERLVNSGSCGAFVLGLEDEFYEVRNNSIDAVCELSLSSAEFAKESLDFLTDMLNDEIDSVRLNAIHSLTKLGDIVELDEEQLKIVLSVLDDSNPEIRRSVHRLLAAAKLSNIVCLSACVSAFLRNLELFPNDHHSLWTSLKQLGCKYPVFCEFLFDSLLGIDPVFAQAEPNVDSSRYISILILIFNAAVQNERMTSLFPIFLKRHYEYLRDKYPHLIPQHLYIQPVGMSLIEQIGADRGPQQREASSHKNRESECSNARVDGSSGATTTAGEGSFADGVFVVDGLNHQRATSSSSGGDASNPGLDGVIRIIDSGIESLGVYAQRLVRNRSAGESESLESGLLAPEYLACIEKVRESLRVCIRDLKHLKQLDRSYMGPVAEYYLLMVDFILHYTNLTEIMGKPGRNARESVTGIIGNLKHIVAQMQFSFVGLDMKSLLVMRQWKILLSVIEFAEQFREENSREWALYTCGTNAIFREENELPILFIRRLFSQIFSFERDCISSGLRELQFGNEVIQSIMRPFTGEAPTSTLSEGSMSWGQSGIFSALEQVVPRHASLTLQRGSSIPLQRIRQMQAWLVGPTSSRERPQEFICGMPILMDIDISFCNVTDLCRSSLVISLSFPDGSRLYHRPRQECFEITSAMEGSLRVPLTVNVHAISSLSYIEICLCRVVSERDVNLNSGSLSEDVGNSSKESKMTLNESGSGGYLRKIAKAIPKEIGSAEEEAESFSQRNPNESADRMDIAELSTVVPSLTQARLHEEGQLRLYDHSFADSVFLEPNEELNDNFVLVNLMAAKKCFVRPRGK